LTISRNFLADHLRDSPPSIDSLNIAPSTTTNSADEAQRKPQTSSEGQRGANYRVTATEWTSSKTEQAPDFRASLFADRTLSWWFPQIDDDEKKSWRIWLSRRSRALLLQIVLVGAILLANLVLTIVAVSRYESENGVGLIYDGDCDRVKALDQWLHLLINLLGTGMLSASNYCMQLQAAPTRANVDSAHAQGKWLDIGVPSLRNLFYISPWRRLSWFLLALSSVPVHLM